RFENLDRGCLRGAADGSFLDDLANIRQGATVVVAMFMRMVLAVPVFVRVIVSVLLPEDFSRQVFFAIGVHIHFGRRNSGTHDLRDLQPRTSSKAPDRIRQILWRQSGILSNAPKHVAAYT